jgi:hypothetical protein
MDAAQGMEYMHGAFMQFFAKEAPDERVAACTLRPIADPQARTIMCRCLFLLP